MSQVSTIQAQFKYNRMQVLFLTGMDEAQYIDFRLDTGEAWVKRFYTGVCVPQDIIGTQSFWQWWNYNWNLRDDRLNLARLYNAKPAKRCMLYRKQHQQIFDSTIQGTEYLHRDFVTMLPEFKKELCTSVNR